MTLSDNNHVQAVWCTSKLFSTCCDHIILGPWYIEPTADSISNPLPMVFLRPLSIVYRLWYFDPPIHGISNLLPMIF